MEYFVVRIYRNEEKSQRSYGVVERVGEDRKESFTNSEELWSILHSGESRGASRPNKRSKKNKLIGRNRLPGHWNRMD